MARLRIRQASPAELAWANARYAEIDFAPSSEADFIAIAEVDGVKAGLGRMAPIDDGHAELGGMFVLPEYRGQSIAAGIVEFLLQRAARTTVFCIPFSHLEHFYRSFGFLPPDESVKIPSPIAEKFAWCKRTYATPVALLHRKA